MKLSIKKIQSQTIFVYLWILILVLDCFSIYYRTLGYQTTQIANIVLTIVAFLVVGKNNLRVKKKNANVLICFITSFTYLLVFCDYKYLGFITGIVVPIILFYTFFSVNISRSKIEELLLCYENIILIIASISLIFYFGGTVLNLMSPSNILSASNIGWSDFDYKSYYGIYFEGQRTYFFGKTIIRNIGIFLEAPVFTYVLITAMYIELFMRNNVRKIPIIIFIVTTFTTFSSTAIAVSLILLFIAYYLNYMKRSWLKLFVPIIAIVVFYVAITVVLDKLSIGNDSGAARLDDFFSCWKAFAAHPLFGVGLNNVRGIDPFRASYRMGGTAGMSSGIPFVFANGGIVHGLIYVLPAVVGVINGVKKKLDLEPKLIGFILVQVLLLTVIVTEYTLLALFFLAMSWFMIVNWRCFTESL